MQPPIFSFSLRNGTLKNDTAVHCHCGKQTKEKCTSLLSRMQVVIRDRLMRTLLQFHVTAIHRNNLLLCSVFKWGVKMLDQAALKLKIQVCRLLTLNWVTVAGRMRTAKRYYGAGNT